MELELADQQEKHLRELLCLAERAKSALDYLQPWLEGRKNKILQQLVSCPLDSVAKMQGEMSLIVSLTSKLNTDIQSGELAHNELVELFNSK